MCIRDSAFSVPSCLRGDCGFHRVEELPGSRITGAIIPHFGPRKGKDGYRSGAMGSRCSEHK
eukprot:11601666-Prorocentrum_lima.AAC.1